MSECSLFETVREEGNQCDEDRPTSHRICGDPESIGSKGRLLTSTINDTARVDHRGFVIPNPRRGRIDLKHRTRVDEHTTLDIEISRQGDANFLKEYYQREHRQEKQQETYVSYRHVVDNVAINGPAEQIGMKRFDIVTAVDAKLTGLPPKELVYPFGLFLLGLVFYSQRRRSLRQTDGALRTEASSP